jgi:Phage P22-like portal protein
MSEHDKDLNAVTEEDIFEEAKERLKISVDADDDNRERARQDLKFSEGDQWDHDVVTTASEESPEITINLTDAMVMRVVNNMRQQRPRGKCHPVGDGADLEIASVINGLGRHIEYRSEASVAYDTAAEMAVRAGVGYWRIISEYISDNSFEQELRILPIPNIFTVYIDPASIIPTGQDATWALISIKMLKDEYKRRYPKADMTGWSGEGTRDKLTRDWESKLEIRLAEYFRINEKLEKLYLWRSTAGKEFTKFESDLPSKKELEESGNQLLDTREAMRKEVQWFKLNGTKIVDRRILPGQWIPIIRCSGHTVDIDGKIQRRGMVRAMQDAQRMVNYGEVAKIKRLGLAPKAPWVVAEGQIDGHPEWNDANMKSYSVLTYKPIIIAGPMGSEQLIPPPQRQAPAQIEAGFSEFIQGMKTNLVALAGMPNEPNAGASEEVISGLAMGRRDKLSDQSHFHFYDNQVMAIAQTWRILLEYIPHYYSGPRMQRIIGEDGVPQMVGINQNGPEDKVKNDLSVGRYDVVMDTGPGYETKREEGAETLLNLLKIGPLAELVVKTGSDLIFRSLDHPYMQELADRIMAASPQGLEKIIPELPERAQAIVKSMAQQIQQMQQVIQQLQLENKFHMGKAQLDAATKVHDTNTRAQTAIAVEDTKAGAELIARRFQHPNETTEGRQLLGLGEQPIGGGNGNAGAGQ